MSSFKTEAKSLIQKHLKEIQATAEQIEGVFITNVDGAVAVIGLKNSKKHTIFQTSFVSENVNKVLDAQIVVQDLLEEDGIEAISEHDFNIALEEM